MFIYIPIYKLVVNNFRIFVSVNSQRIHQRISLDILLLSYIYIITYTFRYIYSNDLSCNFVESSLHFLFPCTFDSSQFIIASRYMQVQVHCSILWYSYDTILTVYADKVEKASKSISDPLSVSQSRHRYKSDPCRDERWKGKNIVQVVKERICKDRILFY